MTLVPTASNRRLAIATSSSVASQDQSRGVGHHAHHAGAGGEVGLDHGERDAGGDRDHGGARVQVGGDLVAHRREDLRLDREDDHLGAAHDVFVVGGGVDAVSGLELVHALAARIGAGDLRRFDDAGGEEALDQRLGHVAGADEANGLAEFFAHGFGGAG
jgi:hypothetical protein